MTVKSQIRRIQLQFFHGDLLVDYAEGESEYMSLVGLCEIKNTGESYGEVLMLDVEQDKIVVYNTLKI